MITLILLTACTGDEPIAKESDTGTAAEEDTQEPGGDTGQEDPGFVPAHFNVSGVFGIDSDAGTLCSYTVDGQDYPPWVGITVYTEGFAEACTVLFSFPSPEEAVLETWTWEDATEAAGGQTLSHTGFMIPDSASVGISDGCADWNSDEYGTLEETVVPHAWGVGIGDLRADVEAAVTEDAESFPFLSERQTAGELLGGSWSADLWEPALWGSHVAYGSPAPDWVLEVDEEGYALEYFGPEDLQGGSLPSGVYVLQSIWGWGYMDFFGG